MSKDATIAPKERVNIVYKPATGEANEEVELPLKMLLLGDYTGQASDTPLEERKAINVDKHTFADVMQQQRLGIDIVVEDKLSNMPDSQLQVRLNFASLKDFEPEGIVQQVEPMQKLLELRAALLALKGPIGNAPEFRRKIQRCLSDANLRKQLSDELSPDSQT